MNGLRQCPHCGRPVHVVLLIHRDTQRGVTTFEGSYLRHDPIARLRVIPDRDRTHCSKCGKPGEWYTFKPGSGECKDCQT